LLAGAAAIASLAVTAPGCDDPPASNPDAGSGAGGEGGCPVAPEPQFRLTIRSAAEALVPADMRLTVEWSAGTQVFELDDPSTWKSLEEGNLVCGVDEDAGPPDDLTSLLCQLWTTGATDIEVSATGYQPLQQTLQPAEIEDCDRPPSSDVDVVLEPMADAGE
ncbi:MAG: hypothetical protein WKG00_28035, partial [Polyangiaceae bacterium]